MTDKSEILIDVRTPSEYQKAHIPGALNLPLFSDEERAAVGTTYVKVSREEAILEGLEYVGPRMSDMVRQVVEWRNQYQAERVQFYCARGGMRSASVAWLMGFYGMTASILPGGFKQYKAQLPQLCRKIEQLILLEAPTGSGKTLVLKALEEQGAQVIDLEGMAQHHGSAFGALPHLDAQRSNEMISCLIIETLLSFDLTQPIFVESESKKIGSREVPEPFFELMKEAKRIELETPLDLRIQLILKEYGNLDTEYLLSAFEKIRKRLGGEACDTAKDAVIRGDLATGVSIALKYYDKAYALSGSELWSDQILGYVPFNGDASTSATEIMKLVGD
ncbi:tRNA 2-selenouridine(34) synthase MnmH [Porphyromonadaceae bacterium W3.11]|nr:tRNA 2-selenouridine(34) synthase MnmH [Porphyromonadaceae bacterium W3.11]